MSHTTHMHKQTKKPLKRGGGMPRKPTRQRLIIPRKALNLNDVIRMKASRWMGKWNELKKDWESLVAEEVEEQGIRPVSGMVRICLTCYEPTKQRDPDNIVAGSKKVILDGLVQAGVLQGDGWKYVAEFKDDWKLDKQKPT